MQTWSGILQRQMVAVRSQATLWRRGRVATCGWGAMTTTSQTAHSLLSAWQRTRTTSSESLRSMLLARVSQALVQLQSKSVRSKVEKSLILSRHYLILLYHLEGSLHSRQVFLVKLFIIFYKISIENSTMYWDNFLGAIKTLDSKMCTDFDR